MLFKEINYNRNLDFAGFQLNKFLLNLRTTCFAKQPKILDLNITIRCSIITG